MIHLKHTFYFIPYNYTAHKAQTLLMFGIYPQFKSLQGLVDIIFM